MNTARPRTTIAAFDFDGTLTRRDTVVPFLRRVAGSRRLAVAGIRRGIDLSSAAARRDRDRLRAIATESVFAGRPTSEIDRAARLHGTAIVSDGLRTDTVERLGWHVDAGHIVVIVSASYEHYVRVVAESWTGVEVIATRLDVGNGVCTGRLDGSNCRGPEKVRRLEAWLAERDLDRSAVELYAYGDSSGDREMLAWADHPLLVRKPLASVAPTA